MKKALITGITGQDGSYLAELLLTQGYKVHGIIRRSSSLNTERINHILTGKHNKSLTLHFGDLADSDLISIIRKVEPDEIYNLGAQSHVKISFDIPEYTGNITALAATRILEYVRHSKRQIKYYQASSSEMYGSTIPPQNEKSPFNPRSPYACAKLYAYWMVNNYREGYNLFAVNGILFNHESPRRGDAFVTRKITRAIAAIKAGKQKYLYLGNLSARRDWGYAPEYVEVMYKLLQLNKPDDFVIGTGENHSVEDFVREAFAYVEMDWKKYVKIQPQLYRPTEVINLIADARKARKIFKWQAKITFTQLIKIMVDADLRNSGLNPIGEGDKVLTKIFPNRWWGVD